MTGDNGCDELAVVGVERLDEIVERAATVHAIDYKASGNTAQGA